MRIKFSHPHFPDGHEFALAHLGVFKNNEEREVDDEQVAQYEAANDTTVQDAFKYDTNVSIDGKAGQPAPDKEQETAPGDNDELESDEDLAAKFGSGVSTNG